MFRTFLGSKRHKHGWRFILFISFLLAFIFTTLNPSRAFAFTNYEDPSEALCFLPPIGQDFTTDNLDESLTDFITITIFSNDGLDLVDEFTSQNKGSERVRLEDGFYMATWHTSVPSSGGKFHIVISVADMEIGSVDIILEKDAKKNSVEHFNCVGRPHLCASTEGLMLTLRSQGLCRALA